MNYKSVEKVASIYQIAMEKNALNVAGRLKQLAARAAPKLQEVAKEVKPAVQEAVQTGTSLAPKVRPINLPPILRK